MAKIQVELQPFLVPIYVIVKAKPRPKHEGIIESPKYALDELDAETLDSLCREFRAAVFGRAGIEDPAEKDTQV